MAMAFRTELVLLAVALAAMVAVAHSTKGHEAVHFGTKFDVAGHGLPMDLDGDEFLMESESARRQLGGGGGYISYGALNRNNVPCNQRGQSYYNCRDHQTANPYQRSCTRATRCARNTR
ncbi:protein RALF-like 19 [Andrographis paniculata]|uniref:protein RALF-like 19 n=1 Tax=Andrographis paniculata TaxID=175694 RepID=UPI0021E8340E|nr:protein RALF-like 19 [Andrographis paniculata]